MCRAGIRRRHSTGYWFHLRERLEREFVSLQMVGLALRVDEGAGGVRIDGSVFAAQFEEHEFGAVVELDAEPVPAGLIGSELFGEPFVIHPCGAVDGVSQFDRAGDLAASGNDT